MYLKITALLDTIFLCLNAFEQFASSLHMQTSQLGATLYER